LSVAGNDINETVICVLVAYVNLVGNLFCRMKGEGILKITAKLRSNCDGMALLTNYILDIFHQVNRFIYQNILRLSCLFYTISIKCIKLYAVLFWQKHTSLQESL